MFPDLLAETKKEEKDTLAGWLPADMYRRCTLNNSLVPIVIEAAHSRKVLIHDSVDNLYVGHQGRVHVVSGVDPSYIGFNAFQNTHDAKEAITGFVNSFPEVCLSEFITNRYFESDDVIEGIGDCDEFMRVFAVGRHNPGFVLYRGSWDADERKSSRMVTREVSCPQVALVNAWRSGDLALLQQEFSSRGTLTWSDLRAHKDAAFRHACASGYLDVAQWLRYAGNADVHACNNFAIRWARRGGHAQVVQWLLNEGAVDTSDDTDE